jgi:hypothetical protein
MAKNDNDLSLSIRANADIQPQPEPEPDALKSGEGRAIARAVNSAVKAVDDAPAATKERFLTGAGEKVAREEGLAGFGAGLMASMSRSQMGLAKGEASIGDALKAVEENGEATKGLASAMGRQVAAAHARISAVAEALKARDPILELVPKLGAALAKVTAQLERNGFVDRGTAMENLRAGRLFINGVSFDLRTLLAALLMIRQGVIVREVPGSASVLNRLWDDSGPAPVFVPAGSLGIVAQPLPTGSVQIGVVDKYDSAVATHIAIWASVPGTANPSLKQVIARIEDVWPGIKKGDVFPATYSYGGFTNAATVPAAFAIPQLFRQDTLRMTHNVTGLITVLAALGISSVDSALAQLPLLLAGDVQGLLRIGGAPDLSMTK